MSAHLRLLICSAAIFVFMSDAKTSYEYHDYIVVGAGPGGLQLGYYLEKAGRDYLILDRANVSGSFFTKYPRHDQLISINKRTTGKTNKEFNLRHDWNSLLSDDDKMLFRHYSDKFFPEREKMVEYLNDFQRLMNIKVRHNVNVYDIQPVDGARFEHTHKNQVVNFELRDKNNKDKYYICRTLVIGTGLSVPIRPNITGIEFTEGYDEVSTNPRDFKGQTVAIFGGGNSAFEVGSDILGETNLVHLIRRSRVKLSWSTHYVGDLRAVNNGILDTYQLKSLDALAEVDVNYLKILKRKNGKLELRPTPFDDETLEITDYSDNFPTREHYDRIIVCLGFERDSTIFKNSTSSASKYPEIHHNYESVDVPGMFYVGGLTHSLDYRKSAGGFIHGLRYTARSLFHLLDWRNHGQHWPYRTFTVDNLIPNIMRRINEASGIYQMFGVLADVISISKGNTEFKMHEEFPVKMLPEFSERTGQDVESGVLVIIMQYGYNFSGDGEDVFRYNRVATNPKVASHSNFLHPVLYYYKHLPTKTEMKFLGTKYDQLPRPDRIHHILEDFLTTWDGQVSHILPLRRFIETIFHSDLRRFFAASCMKEYLTGVGLPSMCNLDLLSEQGPIQSF